MKSKRLSRDGEATTYALIFDTGDEVISTLERFARGHDLAGSHFSAIGAFSDAVVGWFDWETKQYRKIPIAEQVEVLTLAGDISLKDGRPKVHAHVVLGRSDASTRGGHLMEAHVRPTLEVILTESPEHLRRKMDERAGIALISV